MVVTTVDEYVKNLRAIEATMTEQGSILEKQKDYLQELFKKYGFDNATKSQLLAEITGASIQYVNQFASAGAIELIKTDKQNNLIDIQVKEVEAKIRLIDAQTAQTECETKITCRKLAMMDKEEDLLDAKIADVRKMVEQKTGQIAMLKRQEQNYNDNLLIKVAEFESGVASYAINAANKDAEKIFKAFSATVGDIKARS